MKTLFLTNVYPIPERPWEGATVKLQAEGLRKAGVQVDVLHLDRTESGQSIYLTAYPKIKKAFLGGRHDLLHVQFGGVQALLGALVAGPRCVITFHGTDLHGGLPKTMWESASYKIGVICSKLAIAIAGASIAVSKNLLEGLPKRLRKKMKILPTGVDYEHFSPMDKTKARILKRLKTNCVYILFSDNNKDPVKRRDLAEKAVSLLKKDIPNARLMVLSHVPFDEIPLFINAADALLVTSDKEGSPNIVKEALACNLPIVSVAVGDVPDMIAGVKNCRIVPREPRIIKKALGEIIYANARSDGREKKRTIIDNKKICERIIDLYNEVLA